MSQGHLYSEFSRDEAQYQQSERYWQELFTRAVRSEGVERDWEYPWLATRFADGTAFGDGNPIFSAWSPRLALGVRIIQNEVVEGSDLAEMDSWLGTFDQDGSPVRELVISCIQ